MTSMEKDVVTIPTSENKVDTKESKKFPDPSDNLVTMLAPESVEAEAFKILRTNISLRDYDKNLKTINVISSAAGESKTTTIANLAYAYSQLGKRVLLVDMDLRASTLHKKFKLKNKVGVSEVVANECSFSDAVVHYTNKLDILFAGKKNPYASELVQSRAYKRFLDALKERYDIILLDCPPIGLVSDGLYLSSLCDGTLLCVACDVCEKKELEKTKDMLNGLDNVNILGIVMTRVPRVKKYYGSSYGYGYYGYYGYGNESKKKKKNKKKDK